MWSMWMMAAIAQTEPVDVTMEVVDRLSDVGLHDQAYAEALRASVSASTETDRVRYSLLAGSVLWSAGHFEEAQAHFARDRQVPSLALGAGWSAYKAEAFAASSLYLGELDSPDADYLHAWTFLRANDVPGAIPRFAAMADDPVFGPSAAHIAGELATWKTVPYRSPGAAGAMSAVLPGLGQAYVGRWGEAASALMVNGLLIASGVELARRELWFGLGLVAVFELGFYGGGIVSAANGARRFNRRAWRRRIAPLEPYEPAPQIQVDTMRLGVASP